MDELDLDRDHALRFYFQTHTKTLTSADFGTTSYIIFQMLYRLAKKITN